LADLASQPLKFLGGEDEQALVHAACDDDTVAQVGAIFSRQGQPAFIVNCVGELAQEHAF
jgi:hypothetical protein